MWYLAYGSNVNPARFRRYLEGSPKEPGARDSSPPIASRWFRLNFRLSFAGESKKWGGGVAFAHPHDDHHTWFRGWNITGQQFEDVWAQENRLPVGTELPWHHLRHESTTHLDVGERWYRRIHVVNQPHVDVDEPAMTFSSHEVRPHNPPAPAYRDTIAEGLADHPELDEHAIESYLHPRVNGHD